MAAGTVVESFSSANFTEPIRGFGTGLSMSSVLATSFATIADKVVKVAGPFRSCYHYCGVATRHPPDAIVVTSGLL